ncbi:MAG: SpoIID/LytB domain-containing protein [Elusimicrobia bacterium]|nr:SpoIID/LytB domain-containing protein [Elusimicrobiota bacterium]MDY6040242.1 SpoIID/LytB domain-containing protein [Elusimicrobiaceae bacterium]
MKNSLRAPFAFLCVAVLCAACAAPSQRRGRADYSAAKGESPVVSAPQTPEEKQPDPPSQDPSAKKLPADKTVRILITEKQKNADIKHSGRVYIYTPDLSKKYKVSAPGTLAVKALGGGKIQLGTLQSTQTIILEPAQGTLLTWNKNVYSGKIFIIPAGNSFHLVEHAPLETYLYGVLPYEMSYTWPLEALKAQAVAARTYTLKSLENVKNQNFDLYSDVRSQMYKGGGKQYDSVKKAVDETRGQVLTFDDKLFYTYYHANCGGGTDDVRSWNPGAASIKPLSGASCKYDSHSKSHSWQMNVSHAKVLAYAKTVGLTGTLKSIKIARKTDTGRATNLTIRTSKGSKTVACGKFRLATGIRSCKINKVSIRNKDVHFEGKGYGHGVGMCQDGANGMAKSGKDYRKILKNYYPGAKIAEIN